MNNQGNIRQVRKKIKKPPENKLKYMKICEKNDREFKILVLKILNKVWGKYRQTIWHTWKIKSMNKLSTYQRDWNFKREPKRNSGDEELNKRNQEWTSKYRK